MRRRDLQLLMLRIVMENFSSDISTILYPLPNSVNWAAAGGSGGLVHESETVLSALALKKLDQKERFVWKF